MQFMNSWREYLGAKRANILATQVLSVFYWCKISALLPKMASSGTCLESLSVSISSDTPEGMKFSDFSDKEADVLLTLAIPNRLLHHWHSRCPCCMDKDKKLTDLVNSRIKGTAVQLKCNERLNERIRIQTAKVHCKVQQLSGRRRLRYLDNLYYLYVLEGECESFTEVEHELHSLTSEIQEREEELDQLLQDMAQTVMEYEEQLDCSAVGVTENTGKPIEEVGQRQARRKILTFTTFTKKALWFAESFGLIPETLHLRKAVSGSPVKVPVNEPLSAASCLSNPASKSADYEKILQVLYIVDRFCVSDEAYHELSSISKDLPPLYRVKRARLSLNSTLELQRFSGPLPGAYRPLHDALTREIQNVVSIKAALFYDLYRLISIKI
jgi:hypothetical protein